MGNVCSCYLRACSEDQRADPGVPGESTVCHRKCKK
ncbi:LOW QUALITY PROTEIN: FAM153A isoform 4 [Pongo abelii]|uniref:FAM153A isoform 4 n=1 Tax=Pongo abelii TaxID=9601 RepID=A0A2J8R2Q7_PONAB|nr:LOW QUALITY PROTEIN: FAM153A isoform 4 [Pongo abelii]